MADRRPAAPARRWRGSPILLQGAVYADEGRMRFDRRQFVTLGAAAAGVLTLRPARFLAPPAPDLRPITGGVQPITPEEHRARIARAQQLMQSTGLGALLIEPGASMTYFTGVQWWRSERLTAVVLPREGEPA